MKNLLFAWQLSFEYTTNLGEPLLNFLLHILNWWWERCQVPLIIIWNLVLISKIDSIKQYLKFNVENKLLTNFVTFKSPYQAHLKMGSLSVWIFKVVALSTISFCWIKGKKIKLISWWTFKIYSGIVLIELTQNISEIWIFPLIWIYKSVLQLYRVCLCW